MRNPLPWPVGREQNRLERLQRQPADGFVAEYALSACSAAETIIALTSDSRAPSLSSDARQPSPGADASFVCTYLEDVSGAPEPALIRHRHARLEIEVEEDCVCDQQFLALRLLPVAAVEHRKNPPSSSSYSALQPIASSVRAAQSAILRNQIRGTARGPA